MEIIPDREGEVVVVKITGRLDGTTAPVAERGLTAALDSHEPRLVIDMSGLAYISSAGLRVLLVIAKKIQRADGQVALFGLLGNVREVFSISAFDQLFPIEADRATAIAKVRPAQLEEEGGAGLLSFAEEVVLLLLDDAQGVLVELPLSTDKVVIAGAVLMDLAIHDRIDTDLERLTLADPSPTGDDILDDALEQIVEAGEEAEITHWVERIASRSQDYQHAAMNRLVARKILREENGRFLWIFQTRRYPIIDNREQREVRARLQQVLTTEEIPDPRDIVLICLIDACGLLDRVLTAEELQAVQPRLAQLRKMDLIGQAVVRVLADIQASIALAGASVT